MSVSPDIPVNKFRIEGKIESVSILGEGNIHETFLIKTIGSENPDYLLQHKNKQVFKDVPAMMNNISRVCSHIKTKNETRGLDPFRYGLSLIPTLSNELYFQDEKGEYWAMCLYIKDSVSYSNPVNYEMAVWGGQGTGDFHKLLSDFTQPLTDILPGYHNMRFRYEQWDAVINNLSGSRKSEFSREIDWIDSRREEMMDFRLLFESQKIPVRVAHNDAKLLNILFDKSGKVLCLIDLDTVLYGSILYDYGDAIRSYTNCGAEDDVNTSNVKINLPYFEAFTKGYLSETSSFISQIEVESLAFAAKYITFEQLLRFLMDYLDGNRYYRINHPEHNMQRSRAQYALLLEMEKNFTQIQSVVSEIHLKLNRQ